LRIFGTHQNAKAVPKIFKLKNQAVTQYSQQRRRPLGFKIKHTAPFMQAQIQNNQYIQ
jgi:2-keto-4-pentenoate hydratase